jgi:nitrate reductase gamma subunit
VTTAWAYFWWVVLPYLALAVFVVGHVWRWRYDQFGWTSRSTQLQERRWLKWGGPLFHYGTFAAIAGHIMGILIPARWTTAIGISPHVYHLFAASAGLLAAVLVIGGMVVLAARRVFKPRVRATTTPVDWLALVLLGIVVVMGIVTTAVNAPLEHEYRETISLWFRGLFNANPDVTAALKAPLIFQIHAVAAWAVILVWPFTRLVHAWSYPLWYLWRPYIVYRAKRATAPREPGTGGRKWRKIGVPY